MSSIKPIDEAAIVFAAKTGTIIVAHDHNVNGGLGSAVAEVIAKKGLKVKFDIIGIKDQFAESDSQKNLFAKYGMDAETITASVTNLHQSKSI